MIRFIPGRLRIALLSVGVLVVLAACGEAKPAPIAPTPAQAPALAPVPAPAPAPVPAPAPAPAVPDLTVTVIVKDFSFEPKEITAVKGQKIIITVKNNGERTHDMVMEGPYTGMKSRQIDEGGEATFEFVANQVGTFDFICSLRGHKDRGMVGKLIVTEN